MGKHTSLANRLKELRRARSWTQQDLSRSSGLTRSYISRLEMGDIALPSSEKLRALAMALGTSTDDLLQAAGYIDSPGDASDLPELTVYLRRKFSMQDARAIHAIETIVECLQPSTNGVELENTNGRSRGEMSESSSRRAGSKRSIRS